MRSYVVVLLTVLSGCQSQPTAQPPEVLPLASGSEAARLPPPPASVMVPRESNFRQRLLSIFSPSETTPTGTPTSSDKPKP